MKNHLKLSALLVATLLFAFSSCHTEMDLDESHSHEHHDHEGTDGRVLVTDTELLDAIEALDIDVGDVTIGDFHLPDGSVEERIYIGNDIVITRHEIETWNDNQSENERQYRTNNLVTGDNRTISILGYAANDQFSLSSKAQSALQQAVNSYNNISNMSLQFNIAFGSNWQAYDMVVYDNSANNSGSGGVAGFPSSSVTPHQMVQIYNLEGYSQNINRHVITHEIGHSIGFRHTDWFSRVSCGEGTVNEGQGSDGAIHISGTPTGSDPSSVMQACFSSSASGAFNGNDIAALRSMYPPDNTGSICTGYSEWVSWMSYQVGDRVTYFGSLYQRTWSGWTYLGAC